MYANLHGAKIFTTLDLRSGYYHITLDNESKEKTAFVTPFGKYEFNAVKGRICPLMYGRDCPLVICRWSYTSVWVVLYGTGGYRL